MSNMNSKPTLSAKSLKVNSQVMKTVRIAYEEVKQGLPPNYGAPDVRSVSACNNYERVRIACLTAMKVNGALPMWRRGTRIPGWLATELTNFNQEVRLGLETNLVVNLSPGEHEMEAPQYY